MTRSLDSFGVQSTLAVNGCEFQFFDLKALERQGASIRRLPVSLKLLLENLLRHEDSTTVHAGDIEALVSWNPQRPPHREIAFRPARVLLQDFTGVPAVVDLAAMRDAMIQMGGDPTRINPQVPAELVIDHSIQVDFFGNSRAFQLNVEKEFKRNRERYSFLRWGQASFDNFSVVPPATGIVHQVNLECLARVVFESREGDLRFAYPDTLVGTDSHTTMINGLGILGWGVGGIEAEAAMLGQPISLLIPEVVGFKLEGQLAEGATATDLVLTITEMLRQKGVVGKFVEFYGPGISCLSLADRATISNMSPEYGATCAVFPIDTETLNYLHLTARSPERLALVEAYSKAQGLFHDSENPEPEYSDYISLDLSRVEPSLAGPSRPQDRVPLRQVKSAFEHFLKASGKDVGQTISVDYWDNNGGTAAGKAPSRRTEVDSSSNKKREGTEKCSLRHGSIVIAAITSCTNTSNPSVMIGAGLLAQKAVQRGLKRKPWVKASFGPGSKVVTEYLKKAELMPFLEQLGFNLVGYGCTTCIGNSGPLPEPIARAIEEHELVACAVLSGNRNFEGRIHPHVRASYLASPLLVVAYALAGQMDIDLYNEPIGQDQGGGDVYLRDIWPSGEEIRTSIQGAVHREMFIQKYGDIFAGDERWRSLPLPESNRFNWTEASTYIQKPPFFEKMPPQPQPLKDRLSMRVLALLGHSVTTDHISPAGAIPVDSPAGRYLLEKGVEPKDFNSFGSRRGNHEVMLRGTFGNIRLRNLMLRDLEGGYTLHPSSSEPLSIYDAAMKYQAEGIPLLVMAGKEYGSGSSRDWAAKGTRLQGVVAVLAETFERIHRSNLIGMGVLPLQFEKGQNCESLNLTGLETYDLLGLSEGLVPKKRLRIHVVSQDGNEKTFNVLARVDTQNEVTYYRHGGILHYVLRSLLTH